MLQRMNIAALFIRRPVATALIMLGMLFFGAASYVNLPVNQLPNVDFRVRQSLFVLVQSGGCGKDKKPLPGWITSAEKGF